MTAAASAYGDSYCSLAWGGKLGQASDAAVAAAVLNGSDSGLTDHYGQCGVRVRRSRYATFLRYRVKR